MKNSKDFELLDYFATAALIGLCNRIKLIEDCLPKKAFNLALAMLEERKKWVKILDEAEDIGRLDSFAAAALAGICDKMTSRDYDDEFAEKAYKIALQMLKVRKKMLVEARRILRSQEDDWCDCDDWKRCHYLLEKTETLKICPFCDKLLKKNQETKGGKK